MNTRNSELSPILIVGGRTTGLMMAAELVRYGLPVRIIDKSPGIDPHARATFLHSRTLEIFRHLGIAKKLVEKGQPMEALSIYSDRKFIARSLQSNVDSPFPRGVALSQAKIEQALESHLKTLGVGVERNTELIAFSQKDSEVSATVLLSNGSQEVINTPWLIGCDGAHSSVRHQINPSFPGEIDPYPYMLADVIVDGPLNPAEEYYSFTGQGNLMFLVLDEGRRLILANAPKDSDLQESLTLETIQELADQRSPFPVKLSDLRWLTQYRVHYRLVPHYRTKRIFLAGDAAHVHSPIFGLGMNTGIQDAYNLAWKLSMVMHRIVPESWLDSYELERRPVAQNVLSFTKSGSDNNECLASLSPEEREKRVKLKDLSVDEAEKFRHHIEQLDINYSHSSICLELDEECDAGPAVGCQAPDAGPLLVKGSTLQFYDLLNSPRHSMLLFLDSASSDDHRKTQISTVEELGKENAAWINSYIVTNCEQNFPLGTRMIKVIDSHKVLLKRYSGDEINLYLIRPDGYVAFKSQSPENIKEYFHHVGISSYNKPSKIGSS